MDWFRLNYFVQFGMEQSSWLDEVTDNCVKVDKWLESNVGVTKALSNATLEKNQ